MKASSHTMMKLSSLCMESSLSQNFWAATSLPHAPQQVILSVA